MINLVRCTNNTCMRLFHTVLNHRNWIFKHYTYIRDTVAVILSWPPPALNLHSAAMLISSPSCVWREMTTCPITRTVVSRSMWLLSSANGTVARLCTDNMQKRLNKQLCVHVRRRSSPNLPKLLRVHLPGHPYPRSSTVPELSTPDRQSRKGFRLGRDNPRSRTP